MAAIASSVIIFAAQRKLNQTSLFLSKVYSMTMTLDWVLKLGVGVPLSLTRSLCWPWTWDPGGGGSPWPGRTLGRCTAPPGMLWWPCEGWMESMVSRRREEGIKNRQREYKNVKKKRHMTRPNCWTRLLVINLSEPQLDLNLKWNFFFLHLLCTKRNQTTDVNSIWDAAHSVYCPFKSRWVLYWTEY